jgi:Rad3-related DNA helicase
VQLTNDFDGKNKPREAQTNLLTWIDQNLDRADILGIAAPTGIGKSALARALQRKYGGTIVTISNALMDQYTKTYPDVPAFKGRNTYQCPKFTMSCGDVMDVLQENSCAQCPYSRARTSFLAGEATFANPASYYYASLSVNWTKPDLVIIDEAHRLVDFVTTFSDEVINCDEDRPPRTTDLHLLAEWAEKKAKIYGEKAKQDRMPANVKKAARYRRLAFMLRDEPEKMTATLEKRQIRASLKDCIVISQLAPKESIVKRFQGVKTILLSATLLKDDLERFSFGKRWLLHEEPNPIPVANRQIEIKPIPGHMNSKTPVQNIAAWVQGLMAEEPGKNTVVHTTYALSRQLGAFFPGAIVNTPENKIQKIAEFKEKGGLFIASGCAEGVDFPYDECRLNLIPILYRENIGDTGVQKRLAQSGGRKKYDLTTIRTTIQQAGRSTRAPDDTSRIVVGDPGFRRLMAQYGKDLNKDFKESVK